jgi:hypothetical protein
MFDRRRSELEARSSAPPRFTRQTTMIINLQNLTHTTQSASFGIDQMPRRVLPGVFWTAAKMATVPQIEITATASSLRVMIIIFSLLFCFFSGITVSVKSIKPGWANYFFNVPFTSRQMPDGFSSLSGFLKVRFSMQFFGRPMDKPELLEDNFARKHD